MADRVAIVLFNLGGPDRIEAVRPFLRNLFSDPAILRVPFFVRPFLARLIARRRTKPASANYALLGGASPLLGLTEQQGTALAAALPELDAHCFIAMRYWHPFSDVCARAVRAFRPDRVLLLPLYPQFSTTTTGSSLDDWREAAARAGLVAQVTTLCCWHGDGAYAAATARLLSEALARARAELPAEVPLRVLFSAHGLPESIVRAGDPYQFQIERTVDAVRDALGMPDLDWPNLDWVVCYQSRVTPEPWLAPSTEAEIERAAHDRVGAVVVPIAFVSEHSETLVELDVEYGDIARSLGIPGYYRVPTQNDHPAFIAALADIARRALAHGPGLCSFAGGRVCPAAHGACPHPLAEAA